MEFGVPPSFPPGAQAPCLDKSCRILIREYPHRAVAIASSTHALILRHSPSVNDVGPNGSFASINAAVFGRGRSASLDGTGPSASKCMVEFTPRTPRLLTDYRALTPQPIYGTLGLINIGRDIFLCVITQASRVTTVRPGETVEKIERVQFFCLNSTEYDEVYAVNNYEPESDSASVYGQSLSQRGVPIEHPCQELQKLLGNGSFYYSTDFDLTNRMQDRPADAVAFDIDNFDESFLWNSYMISPLVEFRSRMQEKEREALDASRILTSAIRGFCKTWAIPQASAPLRTIPTGPPSYLTIISRLSCKRAGTRFNARGIDDDGNVANFVETETTYWSPSGVVFSYAQVRGSVPVFWEQAAGLLPNQQKISITRSVEGTQPALDKHFADLEKAYGAVHVVNLLSATKMGEAELTQLYRYGIRHCPLNHADKGQSGDRALLKDTEYDFHAETKGPQGYESASEIRRYIGSSAEAFAYYLAEDGDGDSETRPHLHYVVVLQQEGVFRTNCLDCLDRTNLIQSIISQMAVESFLGHRKQRASSDFWARHANLWADNGDALSKIYAGTGALKTSFTRHGKMSLAGAIADVRKSATRLYYNNFADKGRQNTIDTLLGRLVGQTPVVLYDPISDFVTFELQKRSSEFSTTEKITIFVGTFNLNGRTEGIQEDLSPWLCPPELGSKQPEIVAVGFQEIVELNPQQIMSSDPGRKQLWEQAIKQTLDEHARKIHGEKYVLLRSGQLVGAAMCIFVRTSALPNIKNVEGNVKKTGLSGMAGNKGAVAIRMDYASTPICFVTAHLAAGFADYDERNRDYATIQHGLRFPRNRSIDDHDSVIWFGDFNYRIGLGLEPAKELMRRRDLEGLYENDQLNLQMVNGLAFPFYSEARITFMPTYKFDLGTDEYDSSEKARIPAWTDRILRKGTILRQRAYNSAPLRFSDHRPVYATFECAVSIVNEPLKAKIGREIYERRKADVGSRTANLAGEESEDEDLIGYDAIEPTLPPASSDRQKWWLENGKMPRSSITPPKPSDANHQTILNPNRPANPYVPTDEPDWINIPRSESRMSSFSSISTSPYEHINHSMLLSTSASSSTPRKPPLQYDSASLAAKVGRLNMDESRGFPNDTLGAPPPLPTPRRQNTTSSIASGLVMSRKGLPKANASPPPPATRLSAQSNPPAPPSSTLSASQQAVKAKSPPPPVAKKPAHLLGPSSSSGGVAGKAVASWSTGASAMMTKPASTDSSPYNSISTNRPMLPRRSPSSTPGTPSGALLSALGESASANSSPTSLQQGSVDKPSGIYSASSVSAGATNALPRRSATTANCSTRSSYAPPDASRTPTLTAPGNDGNGLVPTAMTVANADKAKAVAGGIGLVGLAAARTDRNPHRWITPPEKILSSEAAEPPPVRRKPVGLGVGPPPPRNKMPPSMQEELLLRQQQNQSQRQQQQQQQGREQGQQQQQRRQQLPIDLLGDDDGSARGVGCWEALRPS